jgi:hypothetical protein
MRSEKNKPTNTDYRFCLIVNLFTKEIPLSNDEDSEYLELN